MLGEFASQCRRAHHEHPCVPQIPARTHHSECSAGRRLFDKAVELEGYTSRRIRTVAYISTLALTLSRSHPLLTSPAKKRARNRQDAGEGLGTAGGRKTD